MPKEDGVTGLSLEEALARLLDRVRPIGETRTVSLADAFGLVSAADLAAPFAVPPFARSAMDGYALRSADTAGASEDRPALLPVAGERMAGDGEGAALAPGTAVRVATGAPVPEGCDAVVKQEHTDRGRERVAVRRAAAPMENVCPAGEDLQKGAPVLRAGQRIGRAELGVLASLGIDRLTVRRRARVALLATGSELAEAGRPLPPGKIYDSVSPMLRASVRAAGLEISLCTLCADDAAALSAALDRAAACSDLVVTTGGVSVGERDLVPAALEALGAETLFRRARVKPGSPTMGSVLREVPVLSLSGNPYAALANFDCYFYPAAAKLMGCPALDAEELTCVAAEDCGRAEPMCRLLRAREEGGRVYFPADSHRSSVISNLTACNCYAVLPPGTALRTGDPVRIRRMKVT